MKGFLKVFGCKFRREIQINDISTLTVLEAESAEFFPHSVQIGLAETKLTEARNRTNMNATRWEKQR